MKASGTPFMLLLPFLACFVAARVAMAYDSREVYEQIVVAGFTVLVHPEVRRYPKDWAEALAEIERQINNIVRVVPDDKLAELRKVRIWVEWQKRKMGAAEFHVSADWLIRKRLQP